MTEECLDKKLTLDEAYDAMVDFLEEYNEKSNSNSIAYEIGGMLGVMVFLEDGMTADPALWNDWIDSVAKILSDNQRVFQRHELVNAKLTLAEAYAAMLDYLNVYFTWTDSEAVKSFLANMKFLKDGMPAVHALWENWIKSVDKILNQNPRVHPRLVLFKKE